MIFYDEKFQKKIDKKSIFHKSDHHANFKERSIDMPPTQNSLQRETSDLRKMMSDVACRLRYTKHAIEEMDNDEIIDADIRAVLNGGHVTWTETKKDEIWHVEGRDCESRKVRVIITIKPHLVIVKIITAMLL